MIKEQEAGLTVAEVCRKHGISPASFYKLKAKYGGMDVSDARSLKQLEDVEPLRRHWFEPNGEGKDEAAGRGYNAGRCGAESPSGKAFKTPARRREAALKVMRDHKISQRRACDLVGVDPKAVRRERPPDHAD